MRITISLPDQLASRFLALVPNRESSATIARLLEQELMQRESALAQACLAAWGNLVGKPGADVKSGHGCVAKFAESEPDRGSCPGLRREEAAIVRIPRQSGSWPVLAI